MLDSNYERLTERLQKRKYSDLSPELKKLISESDFNKILLFLKTNSFIKQMEHESVLRFDKVRYGLPRTLTIFRSKEGEFECILETKSKLNSNEKQKLPVVSGTNKKGKSAWEISALRDQSGTEYFNLVAECNDEQDFLDLKEEVTFSQQFESTFIHPSKLGVFFYDRKCPDKKKVSLYSLKAKSDLRNLLKEISLTDSARQNIISQLLQAVKILHDKGCVHQDLKPANILVFKDGSLALTDFGCHAKHQVDEKVQALATKWYHSPEIAYFHSDVNSDCYQYYLQANLCLLYANYLRKCRELGIERTQFGVPDKANDMWALGVILYQIHYGVDTWPHLHVEQPRIKAEPLLSGLLELEREKRLNIEQAIALFQKKQIKRMIGR